MKRWHLRELWPEGTGPQSKHVLYTMKRTQTRWCPQTATLCLALSRLHHSPPKHNSQLTPCALLHIPWWLFFTFWVFLMAQLVKKPPAMQKKVKESELAQLYHTLCHPMDCTLPGSSVHGISQARKWPQFNSWIRKIPWRRDGLPTPVFLGLSHGSAGKESACNTSS